MSENVIILIRISLQFVPMDAIDNKPALVQVMAWCRKGDNPLHEPMLAQFTDKTRQDDTRQDETRRDETRQEKTRQVLFTVGLKQQTTLAQRAIDWQNDWDNVWDIYRWDGDGYEDYDMMMVMMMKVMMKGSWYIDGLNIDIQESKHMHKHMIKLWRHD